MEQARPFSVIDMLSDDFQERVKELKAADGVYYKILEQIISLQAPPGSLLQERALAEMLDVSRTPVREAVQRLAQDGWLDIRARRHLLVRPVTELDIAEVFELRYMIEPLTLKGLFEKKLVSQAIPFLESYIERMDKLRQDRFQFIKVDQLFHLCLLTIFDNSRLTHFWEIMILETIRIGLIAMQSNNRFNDVMSEHRRILDTLMRRKKSEALEALREHLAITREHVYKNLNLPIK